MLFALEKLVWFSFAFLITFSIGLIIHLSSTHHQKYTARGHAGTAVQSAHQAPTPRIGGIAVTLGVLISLCVFNEHADRFGWILLFSTVPVFLGGLGEDIGFEVSAFRRLVLSLVSAGMAGMLFSAWIMDVGIPLLNFLLAFIAFQIILTISFSAGICHAINLIDGLNGFAILNCITIAVGLLFIASAFGDGEIIFLLVMLLGAISGLLIFNFPFAKIFLGDAGAYALGHILAWLSILLLNRHLSIAPFSILLVFFWPVSELLLSITRRFIGGKPIGMPDKLHVHQIVMRLIEIYFFSKKNRRVTNPVATLLLLPLMATPPILGSVFCKERLFTLVFFFVGLALFFMFYYCLLKQSSRFTKLGCKR